MHSQNGVQGSRSSGAFVVQGDRPLSAHFITYIAEFVFCVMVVFFLGAYLPSPSFPSPPPHYCLLLFFPLCQEKRKGPDTIRWPRYTYLLSIVLKVRGADQYFQLQQCHHCKDRESQEAQRRQESQHRAQGPQAEQSHGR
eukprot:334439-Hanusia_phi.AAC.2